MTDTKTNLAEMQAITAEREKLFAASEELSLRMTAIWGPALEEIVVAVRELIQSSGFTISEVIERVAGPKPKERARRSKKKDSGDGADATESVGSRPTLVYRADETKTYVRGPLPNWMKKAMQDANLDPGSKADRDTFKAGFMTQVAA